LTSTDKQYVAPWLWQIWDPNNNLAKKTLNHNSQLKVHCKLMHSNVPIKYRFQKEIYNFKT